MHGKEEWVLVYLGSQHKCVKRPVWDFPSVSCDYGYNECAKFHELRIIEGLVGLVSSKLIDPGMAMKRVVLNLWIKISMNI